LNFKTISYRPFKTCC